MRKLILTGDDFGRSQAVNEAIERHHQAGVLTQASLMVNEPAAAEAVRIAERNPALCVGLHLVLSDGRGSQRSLVTRGENQLIWSPAVAGLCFAFCSKLERSIQREIAAQFGRFIELGLQPRYWDGHQHLHLHPTVLRLTLPIAANRGFRFTRLLRTPRSFALLPLIFHALSRAAIPALKAHGVQRADQVFGLRETNRMDNAAMQRLVADLPYGISEIYYHPGAEPAAVSAPALREQLDRRGIELTSSERLLAAGE